MDVAGHTVKVLALEDLIRTVAAPPAVLGDPAVLPTLGKPRCRCKREQDGRAWTAAYPCGGAARGRGPRRPLRRWYRYLDWFLILPRQDEKTFLARLTRFEEEQKRAVYHFCRTLWL